jgi:probable HAF family extracellular repeat protein
LALAHHAFITGPNSLGERDIGTLNAALNYFTWAEGINDTGQVVGMAETDVGKGTFFEEGRHAFITGPNGDGMTDLNSLVNVPDGVVLINAIDINNKRQVIATGVVSEVPELETYALMLTGSALIGLMARRKRIEIR